jgi:hypothetical protein
MKRRALKRRYGHAAGRTRSARLIKVGDVILAPSLSGLSNVEAKVVGKTAARRHFSAGKAYDIHLVRSGPVHPSDVGQKWKVYALGEDRYEVVK